jgi:hypothetical protein
MTGRSVLAFDVGELPHPVGQPSRVLDRQNYSDSLGYALDELLSDSTPVSSRALAAKTRSQQFHPDALAVWLVDFWEEVLANFRARTAVHDRRGIRP